MMDPDAVAAHHRPDPAVLARCTELRHLQVALCLLAMSDVLGDLDGWVDSIRSCSPRSRPRSRTDQQREAEPCASA